MRPPYTPGKLYSLIFVILTLGGLLAFSGMPGISLTDMASKFREHDRLIAWSNSLQMHLGDRDLGNVVIGKDGWFFWMDEWAVQDYQRTDLLPETTLISLRDELDRLSEELDGRGITLLVVIPPDKGTIYPQYMPDQIPILGEPSRLDQFMEIMNATGKTRVIDLRPALQAASQREQVYYRTDSHWNDEGSYIGYVEIMKSLAETDPRLAPHPRSDFTLQDRGPLLRDLPRILMLNDVKEQTYALQSAFPVVPEPGRRVLPDKQGIRHYIYADDSLPSLLVYRDSFYNSLAPFIDPHFSEVTNIPYTIRPDYWNLDWIEKVSPDVVIIQSVERYLDPSLTRLVLGPARLPAR